MSGFRYGGTRRRSGAGSRREHHSSAMTIRPTPNRSRDELAGLIAEYFAELEIAQDLEAAQVVGFLDEQLAAGGSMPGVEAAWTDLEYFCAYLEAHPTSRGLEELEPWEYSRLVFEFLESEVYDPLAADPARKRELLSTVVAFLGFLKQKGGLASTAAADRALEQIFSGSAPRPIPRPPMTAGELIGWLNGPNTGLAHRITGSDLWLTLTRDADFDGEWKQVADYIESAPELPGHDKKAEAVRRLASILTQDELDPTALMGETAVTREHVERARKYFYGEAA